MVICDTDIQGHGGDRNTFELITSTLPVKTRYDKMSEHDLYYPTDTVTTHIPQINHNFRVVQEGCLIAETYEIKIITDHN